MKLLAFILLILNQSVYSQDYIQYWSRINVHNTLNSKWVLTQEFNKRWQSAPNELNFFQNDLLSAYRTWVHLKIDKNTHFHLSPFAFFSNIRLNTKLDKMRQNEFRWQVQYETNFDITKKSNFNTRLGLEHRIFTSENNVNNLRLRNRFGYFQKVSKKVQLTLHDEYMINLNQIGTHRVFDQNRITLQALISFNSIIRFEIGATHLTQPNLKYGYFLFTNLNFNI